MTRQGGAEISLRYHRDNCPSQFEVDSILPDETPDLQRYEVIVLGNLRPEGGLGEDAEISWINKWSQLIRSFDGFILKSERDIHACGHRDARCVVTRTKKVKTCDCSPRIPNAVKRLYQYSSAVQFLSPSHQWVINRIIPVRSRQTVIASPVDKSLFSIKVPPSQRPPKALILGDPIRTSDEAENQARCMNLEPEYIRYHSVPYNEMADLLNQYRAIIIYPVMFHAFGRLVVEARLCGCQVIASDRVGALSWKDPIQAASDSNRHFWSFITQNLTPFRKNVRKLRCLIRI